MSRVKKVSNLFVDDVGRVNFVVGAVVSGRPCYYSYRTILDRSGLELFVDSDKLYHVVFNTICFSVSDVSLQSVRKWLYDNYADFAFVYPLCLEV